MNKEEYEKKLAEARKKFGKPFITDIRVPRKTEKSARLKSIEAQSKPPLDGIAVLNFPRRKFIHEN